jgi:hypothetical protein
MGARGQFSLPIIAGFFGVLVAVVLLSWLVGRIGGEEAFDWELAALFGTALGTTLLAITTGALAYLTSREVSATRELAELTRDDQKARERPVVIVHVAVFHLEQDSANTGHISLQVFNAGLGPALRVRIEAEYKDPQYRPQMKPALWPVIMAGGRNDFAIQPVLFPKVPPDGIDPDGFSVTGTYLDRAQETTYDVIVEWRTSKEGSTGAFETETPRDP